MSMSSHVVGYRPKDNKWEDMAAVYRACVNAGVPVPKDVDVFFDGNDPANLPGLETSIKEAVSEYRGDMVDGFDVDVTKLPKDVKIIRFYNSY